MSTSRTRTGRKSRGRQKIEMKKMTNENNLQVTFSKRRTGLFKKASELCTLCGVDVALIVFSPGDKVFSFGHPSVNSIVDRYLSRAPTQLSGTMQYMESNRNANVRELNAQLTEVTNHLEVERKRGVELNTWREQAMAQCWWTAPIDDMDDDQLEQLRLALEDLKRKIHLHAENLANQGAIDPIQFFAGSSSSNPVPVPQPTQLPFFPSQVPQPPQPQLFPTELPQPLPQPQLFAPQMPQPSMLQNNLVQSMPHTSMFNQNPIMQNPMFDGSMMYPHGFNNMGGYGPGGFY